MNEEREFSFLHLFKYALRYFLIVVLCVMLGIGVGVLGLLEDTHTNYEQYTGSLRLNFGEYVAMSRPSMSLSESDFAMSTREISQILETACDASVYSSTVADYIEVLYPGVESETRKVEIFYQDLQVYYGTDSLIVNFYYDVRSEEDRAIARGVVGTYLKHAKANVEANYPEFAQPEHQNVLVLTNVQRDLSLPAEKQESNTEPSSTSRLIHVALYAMVGGVLGVVIILAMYFLDPRLKSVKDVFYNDANCEVIHADEDNSVTEFIARLKGAGAKRILLAAPIRDDKLEAWAEQLGARLTAMESEAKIVKFDAKDPEWLTHFDGQEDQESEYVIYLYNNIKDNAVFYLSSHVEATAFFVDQSNVKIKEFRAVAQEIGDRRYICTLIHNTGNVYLD